MKCAALLIALFAIVVSGCGGGGSGGGGTTPSGRVVVGKVVDVNGNPVPGATVGVQGGGPQDTTLSQGSFRLTGVGTGVRRLTASVRQGGVNYTGSTQVLVFNDATASNANIQVSPSNQQATIAGNVHDTSGRPLRDARVFLGVFVTPGDSSTQGSVASLVAFADNNGNYRLENVPAPVSQYTISASLQNFQNTTTNVNNLQTGETRHVDFTLSGSFGQSVLVPTNVAVFSFTQPSGGQRPFAQSGSGGTASGLAAVYEKIRRTVSPAYARRATDAHPAARTQKLRKPMAAGFGRYAIEMDLYFDNNQPDSLAGFRVYNSEGNADPTPYDFLQDPLANFYSDLDPFYVPNRQFNFAVSAINTDGDESGVSDTSSVVPLDLLTLNRPGNGQTVGNPVNVGWNRVNGATEYFVFVYDAFPSVDAGFTQYNPPGGASSYTLPNLASGDYWMIVAGVTSDGSAVTVTPITKFHVP